MRATVPLPPPLLLTTSATAIIARLRGSYQIDYHFYGELIQHCTDHRFLLPGKQLHARFLLTSTVPGNYLASKLISFYSNHGLLLESRMVFDAIREKSLFSFNAMLIAYSHHHLPCDALRLFSSLSSVFKPDGVSISAILKCLASTVDGSMLREKDGIFGKGHATYDRNVFDLTPQRKSKHYGSGKGQIFGDGSVVDTMPEKDLVSWNLVACGLSIHGCVMCLGFVRDLFVNNGLITMYSKFGDLNSARKVFDSLVERDVVSWNSMISGYSRSGLYDECLKLYRRMEMNTDDMKPNNITVVSALQACSQLKDLDFGTKIHRSLADNKIEMDAEVWNSLVGLYEKCGRLEYARELFDSAPLKDEVSYGVMISGYMNHGFVDEAMDIFRKMERPVLSMWNAVISGLAHNNCHMNVLDLLQEMQNAGFHPNSVTLSSVLPTMAFFSNLLAAKQIHGYAIRNNYDKDIYVVVSLINTYAKSGSLHGARRVFAITRSRSLVLWTSIISAHAAHGDVDSASALFSKMIASGIRPDHITFTAVLTACAHSGEVAKARSIFNAMSHEFRIVPTPENYACMVGVMSRARLLEEAVDIISKMPMKPNAKAWGALLNGASVAGNVEIARLAFDHLVEIEPESDGNYIIMANVYSKAGRWKEATKMREEMKRTGLAKIPGCSWIETSDGFQVFVATDISNTSSMEMYDVLGGLVEIMTNKKNLCSLDDELNCEINSCYC